MFLLHSTTQKQFNRQLSQLSNVSWLKVEFEMQTDFWFGSCWGSKLKGL